MRMDRNLGTADLHAALDALGRISEVVAGGDFARHAELRIDAFEARVQACVESLRPHLGNLCSLGRDIEGARASWGVPGCCRLAPALTCREREVMAWLCSGKT